MNPQLTPAQSTWPEALATVTSCHYEFGAGRALAFGVPTSKHFRITYNYNAPDPNGPPGAPDILHTGEFTSAKAIPQGHLFPVRYNPEAPHENSYATASITRSPILAIGIIGSIILSAAWFLLLKSCH